MPQSRYLTKSRFKMACECPTKLFYTRKKDEYADKKMQDTFLKALAEGGFQIGELAKQYYPAGFNVETLEEEVALKLTNDYLNNNDDVVIFEAAVRFENCFIRVDILEKKGNEIRLLEVKAKSYDSDKPFLGKNGFINATWSSYLYDVAFQKYVVEKAFPQCKITPFLMLVDKTVLAATEGLNHKFRIKRDGKNTKIDIVGEVNKADLSNKLLIEKDVTFEVDKIFNNVDNKEPNFLSFEERIQKFSAAYSEDKKNAPVLIPNCGKCEFRHDDINNVLKSGFHECWKEKLGNNNDKTIFDLWNSPRKQLIDANRFKLIDVIEEDFKKLTEHNIGEPMTRSQRQWLQIEKAKESDKTPFIDTAGLRKEFATWKYPLHFIDFETSMVAIPFYKGRRPYEQLAFQFSHHVVEESGNIRHAGQYLNAESQFPNYDFLRVLKRELENDDGTIFRFAPHENSVLRQIREQLTNEIILAEDMNELLDFIDSITQVNKDECGIRNMVDFCELVKKYTLYPETNGSASIKPTLPAVLSHSLFLQEKYSKPIYGKNCEIGSLNFLEPTIWLKRDANNQLISPYKQLPKVFEDLSFEEQEALDNVTENEEIADGGAAMTAWAAMHFSDMSDVQKEKIKKALLKYCELDTLAMVMIYESWKAELTWVL